MNFRLIVRPEAEEDISGAFEWYEGQYPGLGAEFFTAVEESFDRIASAPYTYPILYKGVRRALMGRFPYSVFFVTNRKVISVLAVLHQARDPRRWPRLT